MSTSQRQLARATTIVGALFVASRVLGLVREIVISHQFGTSRALEAYLAAIRIPDLIFNLVAGGALGSAFIPLFAGYLAQDDKRGAWRLASAVINSALVVLVAGAGVTALFAPQVASLIATGFTREEQALTASLMRIMLVTPIVFGVSGIVMGILQSHQEFTLPALAPVMYNLAIIGGALFLAPLFGVYGLAYGVVAGAVLHLAIQVPYLLKIEMRYARILAWGDAAVREVGRLMLPRTLGLAAVQINFLVNTILASTLPEGRLAALNYAFLLMLLPQGVIAQSIATTIFPTFSAQAAREDWDNLRATFSTALRVTFFLTIPASVGLILLRVPLVELLLQRGAFNADSTAQTAFALAFFALGLFAHSGLEIVTRGFYALHDTATPVKVGIGAMVLNIALSLILLGPLAQGGLALANSVATILEMSVLLFVFRTRMGKSEDARIGVSLARVVIASALMGASVWGVARVLSASSAWLVAGAGVLVGAGVYAGAVFVLRAPELKSVI